MYSIYDKLNIPDNCRTGNTIYKKMFYDMGSLSAGDKAIFKDDIDKITWQYSISPSNANIPKYKDDIREYDEIAVIEIELSNIKRYKRMCEIIQINIPYPILLIAKHENEFALNLAHKRTNLTDSSKNTVDDYHYSEWIDIDDLTKRQSQFLDSIEMAKQSFNNLYEFYNSLIGNLIKFNASIYSDDYESVSSKNVDEIKAIQNKIEKIDLEIVGLRSKMKKELHFNNKIKINVELKRLSDRKDILVNSLK